MLSRKEQNPKLKSLVNLVLPTRYVEHIQERLRKEGKKVYSQSTIHKTRMGYIKKPNPDVARILIDFSKEYQQLLNPQS